MPIVIQPTPTGQKMMNKKMDKMGGGGMDIPMIKKKMKMSGKMEDMREYMDVLDGIEEDTTNEATWPKSDDDESAPQVGDTVMHDKHGLVKVLKITDTDMMGEPAEYVVQTKGGAKNISYDQLVMGEAVEEVEEVEVDEAEFEEGNKFIDARRDAIKAGKTEFEVDGKKYKVTGDTSDEKEQTESVTDADLYPAPNKDTVVAMLKKHPEEAKKMMQAGDVFSIYGGDLYNEIEDYMAAESGIYMAGSDVDPVNEINDMLDGLGLLELPNDAMGYGEDMQEQDIEMEEDCGCDDEAIDAMVSVPVQELQDILQLAGYENYAEKIQEYANEPEEEYSSVEDQLIGLSGGLNGPKKMYPASADGDNPMNQEPREVEETMEAVEEKLYKSYKDFLEEAEIDVK